MTRADEAQAALAFVELAEPRTDVALDAAVRQGVPVAGGEQRAFEIGIHAAIPWRAAVGVSHDATPRLSLCSIVPLKARAVTAIRSPAVAGAFYPAEPDALRRQLAQF